jgi:hypothetical protein
MNGEEDEDKETKNDTEGKIESERGQQRTI